MNAFEALGLSGSILESIREVGYEKPTPVQAASIPVLLSGSDMIGQAQTGTGKTAAFALPILQRLDPDRREPQALVLTPTRELALQVAEAFQTYARHTPGFHILPVYGGQGMQLQLRQLKRGAHVVVGTPGRLMDHLKRGTLKLNSIQTLVLDEADEMLAMGFIEDIEWILGHTPDQKQTALFSATMPKRIRDIAGKYLKNPQEVRIKSSTATVSTTEQSHWQVKGIHKLDALTRILEAESFDAMIIFVRTRNSTEELAQKLEARGYDAAALNGDMAQAVRTKTVERLKQGQLDILIATDVAARGLDVERVSHVINYDIPYDTESYVHRIGRTGRAGRKGKAILFVSPRETRMLRTIEKATRQKIEPIRLPTREDVAEMRVQQFKQMLTKTIEEQDLDFYKRLIGEFKEESGLPFVEIAGALVYQLQKERPLQALQKEHTSTKKDIRQAEGSAKKQRPDKMQSGYEVSSDRKKNKLDREKKKSKQTGFKTQLYQIAVGSEQNVDHKSIVGFLMKETGIEAEFIGAIEIGTSSSTVELPKGMPGEIVNSLKKAKLGEYPIHFKPCKNRQERRAGRQAKGR